MDDYISSSVFLACLSKFVWSSLFLLRQSILPKLKNNRQQIFRNPSFFLFLRVFPPSYLYCVRPSCSYPVLIVTQIRDHTVTPSLPLTTALRALTNCLDNGSALSFLVDSWCLLLNIIDYTIRTDMAVCNGWMCALSPWGLFLFAKLFFGSLQAKSDYVCYYNPSRVSCIKAFVFCQTYRYNKM